MIISGIIFLEKKSRHTGLYKEDDSYVQEFACLRNVKEYAE